MEFFDDEQRPTRGALNRGGPPRPAEKVAAVPELEVRRRTQGLRRHIWTEGLHATEERPPIPMTPAKNFTGKRLRPASRICRRTPLRCGIPLPAAWVKSLGSASDEAPRTAPMKGHDAPAPGGWRGVATRSPRPDSEYASARRKATEEPAARPMTTADEVEPAGSVGRRVVTGQGGGWSVAAADGPAWERLDGGLSDRPCAGQVRAAGAGDYSGVCHWLCSNSTGRRDDHLNRPGSRNALSIDLLGSTRKGGQIGSSSVPGRWHWNGGSKGGGAARVLVLTGAGTSFCGDGSEAGALGSGQAAGTAGAAGRPVQ